MMFASSSVARFGRLTRLHGVLGSGGRKWLQTSCQCFSLPVKMPSLSPTMTEGTIVKWAIKEGEEVNAGDVLCEIQTDKAVVAMEFDEDGVLAKILSQEGSANVPVGQEIAVIAEPGEDWQQIAASASVASSSGKDTSPSPTTPQASPSIKKSGQEPSDPVMGPSVRLLLQLYQINSSEVPGTGHKGRLLKSDVLSHISLNKLEPKPQSMEASKPPNELAEKLLKKAGKSQKATKPPTEGPYVDVKLEHSELNKRIAGGAQKFETPHAYVSVDVSFDLSDFGQEKSRLEMTHKLIWKAAKTAEGLLSLRLFPEPGATSDSSIVVLEDLAFFTAFVPVGQVAVLTLGQSSEKSGTLTLCYNNGLVDDGHAARFMQLVQKLLNEPELMLLGMGGSISSSIIESITRV